MDVAAMRAPVDDWVHSKVWSWVLVYWTTAISKISYTKSKSIV